MNYQPTESLPQTQQSKQNEKADKYSTVKEHDKYSPNQTKEEKGNLSEKIIESNDGKNDPKS